MLIRKNPEAALCRLRALPETALGMRYWVDALCINQEDKQECAREVKRMGELYNTASSIVVWLSPEADESNRACDIIAGMAYLTQEVFWLVMPQTFEPILHEPLIFPFLNRLYSRRVWIIQELTMNLKSTTLIVGIKFFCR